MSPTAPLPSYSSYKWLLVTSPSPFVAHVEINRPKKLNAFVEEMWLEFGRVFNQLSSDQDVRAVVLSGAGDRAFTAGLDVQAAAQDSTLTADVGDVAKKAKLMRAHILEFQDGISAMEKCEKRESFLFLFFLLTWHCLCLFIYACLLIYGLLCSRHLRDPRHRHRPGH